MQAFVYEQYGTPDVLQLKTLVVPTPKDNEVLIKVYAVALNAADGYLLSGSPFLTRLMAGLSKPNTPILGSDIAGRVEAIGKQVRGFKVGDEVFGDLSGCGLGGLAEYVCAPEAILAHKPSSLSFAQSAAVPMSAITALQALRDYGKLQAGQTVLINGASGGVGTFAVQIAKLLGAQVTAVCSASKTEMMRTLGADAVIDYSRENFTQSQQRYDLILGINGYQSLREYQKVLKPQGIYVAVGGKMKQIFQAMLLGRLVALGTQQTLTNMQARPNAQDLAWVGDLLQAGKLKPVIDQAYSFSDVPTAFRYLGQKHAKGKLVIKVVPEA